MLRNACLVRFVVSTTCVLLPSARESAGSQPVSPRTTFTDVTDSAGITFRHVTGATGRKYMPETMGSGVAFLDYDQDGWMDFFLVNSASFPGSADQPEAIPALYRNNGNGTFTDMTRRAGLGVTVYGMGATVGDYDNDGFPDLYLTAVGPNRLFHNNGNGTFSDVTETAGVGDPAWGTSATWFDADNDGMLDLFVCNYVQWSIEGDKWCGHIPDVKSYCTPEIYEGTSSRLYRNLGKGRFQDVTEEAGLLDAEGKALGVALWDFNDDGLMDLVVAQDTQPDRLLLNRGGFRFNDVGIRSGLALSESGLARGGMGIDVADLENNGGVTVAVNNFSYESIGFYRQIRANLFANYASQAGVGQPSLLSLGFGLAFLDYDQDGWADLFVANGHIDDLVKSYQTRVSYRQPPQLFRNLGNGKFQEVGRQFGAALRSAYVGRGLAIADYDNDGDPDVLITENGGPAHLFRLDRNNRNHWLEVLLVGRSSNRDGVGTRVTLKANEQTQRQYRRTGSSYLSTSDPRLVFGLGPATRVEWMEVRWPSGETQKFEQLPAEHLLILHEGDAPIYRPVGASWAVSNPSR